MYFLNDFAEFKKQNNTEKESKKNPILRNTLIGGTLIGATGLGSYLGRNVENNLLDKRVKKEWLINGNRKSAAPYAYKRLFKPKIKGMVGGGLVGLGLSGAATYGAYKLLTRKKKEK